MQFWSNTYRDGNTRSIPYLTMFKRFITSPWRQAKYLPDLLGPPTCPDHSPTSRLPSLKQVEPCVSSRDITAIFL